jgi:hypothetical protein
VQYVRIAITGLMVIVLLMPSTAGISSEQEGGEQNASSEANLNRVLLDLLRFSIAIIATAAIAIIILRKKKKLVF